MATAKRAFGTKLYRETTPASGGSGTTGYTALGGVTGLNFPELQTDVAETTDMDAASAARTRLPTLNNLGEVSFQLNFDSSDATHEQMVADQVAQTIRKYKIIGTDAGAADWAFDAYVTRFAIAAERDGILTASVTLTPTGAVTRS